MIYKKSKRRLEDERGEKAVSDFLWKYFYPTFFAKYDLVAKVHNDELQWDGVDVIAWLNGASRRIDEKASIRTRNVILNTYAVEGSFKNKAGIVQRGSFYNDSSLTTHFNLMYVFTKKDAVPKSIDDISKLCLITIEKSVLQKEVEKYMSFDRFWELQTEMREKGIEKMQMPGCPFKLVYSKTLKEEPINITINRMIHEKYGKCYIVTKDGVKKVKTLDEEI